MSSEPPEDSLTPDSNPSEESEKKEKPPGVCPHAPPEGEEAEFLFYKPSCHCLEEARKAARFVNYELRVKKDEKVLEPDHPALAPFQKALKEHLVKQIEHLQNDITNYEVEAKSKNATREAMGVETYELQQVVCKQQQLLENYIRELKTVTAANEEMAIELNENKNKYKKENDILFALEKEEREFRNEVESINLLLQQTTNWEEYIESELSVNRRVAEKTRKDQMHLMRDKRFQDMLLYRLQTSIWKLETDLETADRQLQVKEKEREDMAQTVAEGTTNIEALEAEYRCLMHSWDSVIIAVSNRDKVLMCINAELNKYQEEYKTILSEIEQIKKLTKKEMQENENLTMIKQRITADITICKTQTDDELHKQQRLEKKIATISAIIEQIESDITKTNNENNNKETMQRVLDREYDKVNLTKFEMEEKVILKLEDQSTNNKAAHNLSTRYRAMKTQNRQLEISLAASENKNAIAQAKYESQLYINIDLDNLLKELDAQRIELEKENSGYQDQLNKFEYLLKTRARYTDTLNTKVLELINKMGGKEISPLNMKIKTLEKNIEEIKEKIKDLQQFWLREQRNLLELADQRQKQIASNNLVRKQLLILQQKNLRVTDELEAIKKHEQKTARNILNLHNQIYMICDVLMRKKGQKKNLDMSNGFAQAEYISKLKDAELECLKLQADIAEFEDDKATLSDKLIEVNRFVLEWEKKLTLIKDTKSQINDEKSAEGEVGQMKAEVHRMEVRYLQLKKCQDQLAGDLQYSVCRREAIVSSTEAREKRSRCGMDKTRFNFNRKLDDVRNKIKQVENETACVEGKIVQVAKQRADFESKINNMKDELDEIRKITEDLLNEYENAKTNKLMNFELLVLKQKKLNLYSDLAKGRKPFLAYKNECILVREYDKHNELNNNLINIVENLLGCFPNYYHQITRVVNTLSLPKVYTQIHERDWECADLLDD